jgi:hypothetical protein
MRPLSGQDAPIGLYWAGDFACRGEHVSGLGRGEGLGRDRALYTAAARCDERQNAGGLGVGHFRDDHEIVLAEREIKRDQLAARLLTQPRNRGVPVLRLC